MIISAIILISILIISFVKAMFFYAEGIIAGFTSNETEYQSGHQPQTINEVRIISFNIMSTNSSNYSLPKSENDISMREKDYDPSSYKNRYRKVLEKLKDNMFFKYESKYSPVSYIPKIDIVCLQEIPKNYGNNLYLNEFEDLFGEIFDKLANEFHIIKHDGMWTMIRKNLLIPKNTPISSINGRLQNESLLNFSKIQSTFVVFADLSLVNIVNVHLAGDPDNAEHAKERKQIIKGIIGDLEVQCKTINLNIYKTTCYNIIVGDFNTHMRDLISEEFRREMCRKKMNVGEGDPSKVTSYSRFYWDGNQVHSKPEDKAWAYLDNILYSNGFELTSAKIVPGDFGSQEVPYKRPNIGAEPYKFVENYDVWPSDHAMMLYTLGYSGKNCDL